MDIPNLGIRNGSAHVSDLALVERIYQVLGADKELCQTDYDTIGVKVRAGVVTLNGHVTTATKKMCVDNAVRGVTAVAQFENQLTIDEELTLTVAHQLGYAALMQGEQMGVNVQHGFVYLSGTASSATIRQVAAQLAADVPQVRGVINRIQAPGILPDPEEERLCQPAIGREVFAQDCVVGRLQQVILNPHNRRVTALVVLTDFSAAQLTNAEQPINGHDQPARTILIPISAIRYATGTGIFLGVSSGDVARFADLNVHNYLFPPADWAPPYPYLSSDVRLSVALPVG
jgi:osmotically-inducible protein OsmY